MLDDTKCSLKWNVQVFISTVTPPTPHIKSFKLFVNVEKLNPSEEIVDLKDQLDKKKRREIQVSVIQIACQKVKENV